MRSIPCLCLMTSFLFKSIIYITILNHLYNSEQDAWAVCAQIVDCLYKYTAFWAKKSVILPICLIPNAHAHTIGIVFASSKPIGIEYSFDDVWIKRLRLNSARLNDWIYWWTIEFIQFNFSIAHRWRKDGCQPVHELGLDQFLDLFIFPWLDVRPQLQCIYPYLLMTLEWNPKLLVSCGTLLLNIKSNWSIANCHHTFHLNVRHC